MDGQYFICEKVGSLREIQLRKQWASDPGQNLSPSTRALIKIKKLYPNFVSEHSYRDIVQIIAEELGVDV